MIMMGIDDEVTQQIVILYRCRKQIVTDLDVHDILPELLSNLVIDHRDKQLIDHESTLEDKAERLLIILEKKATNTQRNPNLIPVFINSLKTKYKWLFKELTEDVPDSRVIPLLTPIKHHLMESILREDQVFESPKEQKAKILLEAGGVQCLPAFAVERKDLMSQIREELQSLKRNRYLVIQGMPGAGKSVLATQAISNVDLVNVTFPGGIFWLAIGKECSESKDALLAKMRILCEKLGESRAPNSFEHGQDLLRTAFMKRPETLLVLDDVWRSETVRAFDVGCRTLVTTRDLSVMDVVNGRFTHIRVHDGFFLEESLDLFSQALGKEVSELPSQAKAIHVECKGSPMVISLISSLLQEHRPTDTGRWQYYLDSLSKRKYSKMRRHRNYEHESIVDAIALSIEGLPEDRKVLYFDFGLFQDDVGIPCSVLMTLWTMQKYEVEDIMKDFVRKNLAIEEYDTQKKCYIYSIHDLLLDYLKYYMVSEENREKKSHENLVEKYLQICNGDFHKLPDDGYIHFYLGYHLYKSKLYNYFQKIYLDLQFIGEKLRITGPADLLVDIRKYLDFIVGDDEERLKHIEEIQTFAQLVGHRIYNQLDVDIIQVALQTPHLTRIHQQAKILARIAGNRLYLEWKNAGQWKNPESTVLCSDHVNTIKFVGNMGGHFIAGLSSGCIQLCDLESSAVCHVFFGHSDSVQSIQVHSLKSWDGFRSIEQNGETHSQMPVRILSASADKTCKIWDLKTILDEVESKPFELKTGRILGTSPSPKLRPDQWAFDQQRDDSCLTFELHTAAVNYAEFSRDGFNVVSTSTNEIMIWNSRNGQVISKISPAFEKYPDLTFQRCLFPPDNSNYLLCSAENQIVLLSSERSSIYSAVEGHPMRIVELLFISQDCFCTVSEIEIGIWKVTKKFCKQKAFRSRSLSPSRCMQLQRTQVDSKKIIRPSAKTLDPKDIQVNWSNGDSSSTHELKSPSSKSTDCSMLKPCNSSVFIEVGDGVINICREDVLLNVGAGLLLCAATASVNYGRLLACGTSDHKIVLWRLDGERQFLGSFTSHNGWVTCLDFSLVDTYTLLSGSEDHTVMVWDIRDEEKGTKEPQKRPWFSSAYVPFNFDQGYFISMFATEKNTIQVYKDTKRISETVPFNQTFTAVVVSDCGKFAAAGNTIGEIFQIFIEESMTTKDTLRKTQLETKILANLESKIACLSLTMAGKILMAGSSDGSLMVLKDFEIYKKFKISTQTCFKTFVFGDYAIAVAQDSSAMIMNLNDSSDTRTWKLPYEVHVTCAEFSANGSVFGIGTSDHGVVIVQLTEDFGEFCRFKVDVASSSPVRAIAFSSDSTELSIGYDNGLISIWNIDGDTPRKEKELVLHKSWVRHLKFSTHEIGNAPWLISCGDKIAFWNLDKHEVKQRRSSFMAERRRRRSGESPVRNSNRLSLEIPDGKKIGRQGKRELLQQFSFRGNYAQHFFTDPSFGKILTVDDTGIFYVLESLKSEQRNPLSAKI